MITKLIMYGKSAIGLAEDLDLFIGVEDLMDFYVEEVEKLTLINGHPTLEYKEFVDNFYSGKFNKISKKAFIKDQRSKGNFIPEEITGDDLVTKFRTAFPNLNTYLENFAEKATIKSYAVTKDSISRIRFFEPYEKEKERRAILRAAQNYPIQGSAANMTKYAAAKIKRYLDDNNLNDKIKFALPIHDELLTFAKEEIAEEWFKKMMEIMEEAGEFILDNNLQKAEGKISSCWEK